MTKERLKMLRECKRLRTNERLTRKQCPKDAVPSSNGHSLASEDTPQPSFALSVTKGPNLHSKLPEHAESLSESRPAMNPVQDVGGCVEVESLGNPDNEKRPLTNLDKHIVRYHNPCLILR